MSFRSNLKQVTRGVVLEYAKTILNTQDRVTTLEVKNELRDNGYYAVQQGIFQPDDANVSWQMDQLHENDELDFDDNGTYREYFIPSTTSAPQPVTSSAVPSSISGITPMTSTPLPSLNLGDDEEDEEDGNSTSNTDDDEDDNKSKDSMRAGDFHCSIDGFATGVTYQNITRGKAKYRFVQQYYATWVTNQLGGSSRRDMFYKVRTRKEKH